MNKTSSTRSYVFSLCETDLLKWARFNEVVSHFSETTRMIHSDRFCELYRFITKIRLKRLIHSGSIQNCIWCIWNSINRSRSHCAHTLTPPPPPVAMMSFCFNGWGRGCNRQLLRSSQSRSGKENSGSLCPWSVGGSNGSAPLLHSQPNTWTHTAPSKKRNLQRWNFSLIRR